ncbi:WAT1-related protein At2g39510-like [Impatiens glandulifera]|uniref:WAT1-related protein At2g39510-like n=1 Tax=Impatiens glandulifera TaxID=253017 RepID=UPI001FB06D57|nr:WAT1-related protein At2g39510-like [Impatiens glandulifera]
MGSWLEILSKSKVYLCVIFLQFGLAGMSIIAKSALNQGMNHYTFAVYRNAIAAIVFAPFAMVLERKVSPRMTLSIWTKIMLLGLLEPVLDQNLYYNGIKYTTASFGAAMGNILPALVFVMAWLLRLENVEVKKVWSQAQIVGTLVTLGGAMIMTLVKGPNLGLPWTQHQETYNVSSSSESNQDNNIKGSLMIIAGCFCWASFYILQAITLKSYPASLSLTTLICLTGSLQGTVVTLFSQRGNAQIWSLHFDSKLLAALYGGVICSGVNYYISLQVMKEKGPVFVTSFNPLSMVLVTIMGSFFLSEQINLGRVVGSLVIVAGLYMVMWGKSKEKRSLNNKQEINHIALVDLLGNDKNEEDEKKEISKTEVNNNSVKVLSIDEAV